MPIAYANQTFFHKALPLITFMTRQLLGLNENHLNQPALHLWVHGKHLSIMYPTIALEIYTYLS